MRYEDTIRQRHVSQKKILRDSQIHVLSSLEVNPLITNVLLLSKTNLTYHFAEPEASQPDRAHRGVPTKEEASLCVRTL